MEVTPELLKKYYQGQCTEEEIAAVRQWLRSDILSADLPESRNEGQVVDELWQELETGLLPDTAGRSFLPVYRLLAAAVVLLFLVFGYWRYRAAPPAQIAAPQNAAVPLRTLKTTKGERRAFVLSDGTEVFLNSDSELRLPARFTDSVRRVSLRGEARFKVAADTSRPFLVHTPTTVTRVLGTIFTLKNYPETVSASLVVEQGKVLFSPKTGAQGGLLLTAGQRGFTAASGTLRKEQVFPEAYSAWTRRQLVFSDEPLSEIARTLERWYNIRVLIKSPSIASRRCTGSFADPPLPELLSSLGYSLNFRYHLKQNTLTIY